MIISLIIVIYQECEGPAFPMRSCCLTERKQKYFLQTLSRSTFCFDPGRFQFHKAALYLCYKHETIPSKRKRFFTLKTSKNNHFNSQLQVVCYQNVAHFLAFPNQCFFGITLKCYFEEKGLCVICTRGKNSKKL